MIVWKRQFIRIFLLLISSASFGQDSATNQADCTYDRSAMFALSETEFDQNPNGGWRTLAQNESCLVVVANLIKDYRTINSNESSTLYWHEGQVRAMAGQSNKAVALFKLARVKEDSDLIGWNHYVSATIAFIQKDKKALIDAREHLVQIEQPSNLRPSFNQNGKPMEINWPPNLDVVDRLIRCFDNNYKQAYRGCPQ